MVKTKGKKEKPRTYDHIATAIIPPASIVALPSVAPLFPKQKIKGADEWSHLIPSFLRASYAGEQLIPSSANSSSLGRDEDDDEDEDESDYYQKSKKSSSMGRMDASTDDDSDEEHTSGKGGVTSSTSRSVSVTETEKRLFGHQEVNDKSITTTADPGLSSTIRLDAKPVVAPETARSATTTTSTTSDDKERKKVTVTVTRQYVPPLVFNPVPSTSAPSTARSITRADTMDGIEGKSLDGSTTARSSVNDSTTVPNTARSVSFKEPVVHQVYEAPSSKSQPSTTPTTSQPRTVIDKSVIQPSEEYQRNFDELEKHYEQELASLRKQLSQDVDKSTVAKLKKENADLQKDNQRLNAALSESQQIYLSDALKKSLAKYQSKIEGLPNKGPIPIWLLNRKFLSPLFTFYEHKLKEREEFVRTLESKLNDLAAETRWIANENASLHQRLTQTQTPISPASVVPTLEIERIKQYADRVLEDNKILHEQLEFQTHRLSDAQKSQNQEVSSLTRRLMVLEKEKSDGDRTIESLRMRNEELRKQYDQLLIGNDRRIDIDDHVREVSDLKRSLDQLSEKHASELKLLLRRVQEAEGARQEAQMKLTEHRQEMDRIRAENKATNKLNRKLQLRVQTFEKKLEVQQMKEQNTATVFEQINEELERRKLDDEIHSNLVKDKDEDIQQLKEQLRLETKKSAELERRLETIKYQSKENVHQTEEQTKKQMESLEKRCREYEERFHQLSKSLAEKQILIDDLNAEKRNFGVSLENIWLTSNADNQRMHEQLRQMKIVN